MKILLNLLQEEKRKEIQKRFYFRFFLWQIFLLLVLGMFYLAALFSIYFTLNFQFNGLQSIGQQYDAENSGQRTLDLYRKKFRETNMLTETAERIERYHFSFTKIFFLLDSILPESVMIDSITTKEYTVLIAGRAATRDDLLMFESSLKASECVKNVNVPLSNLFSQENVDFKMDFEMRKECLQKNAL